MEPLSGELLNICVIRVVIPPSPPSCKPLAQSGQSLQVWGTSEMIKTLYSAFRITIR